MLERLKQAAERGGIRHLDYHFARFMCALNGDSTVVNALALACCQVSYASSLGHSCINLTQCADNPLFITQRDDALHLRAPTLEAWLSALRQCRIVGSPGAATPLILDKQQRFYLARFWWYEKQLADALNKRAETPMRPDPQRLKQALENLFPTQEETMDWQKIAAAIAVRQRFTVISGGPGAGKTTTITKVLALIILLADTDKPPAIALAAPTGKAAARLTESIRAAKQSIAAPPEVLAQVPESAMTIHRLLHINPTQNTFKYTTSNPLPLDVLVVDEASMIDLSLMAHLIQALPAQTQLILLGDKDQLASVEAGNVLGDICHQAWMDVYSPAQVDYLQAAAPQCTLQAKPVGPNIRDAIVVLKKSYRFGQDSGIMFLARHINQGDAQACMQLLQQQRYPDIDWHHDAGNAQIDQLLTLTVKAYCPYLQANNIDQALNRFALFRLLCALREGPWGVIQINRLIEHALARAQLIDHQQRWYQGRPIMVTENDYSMNLFNGDIGILWPDDTQNNKLRVYFRTPENQLRKVLPNRLPSHETVFAMTIHKSQGSEFQHTAVLLPENDSPILTRELLYTAITRAKQHVTLLCHLPTLQAAVRRKTIRRSGLRDKLWRTGR